MRLALATAVLTLLGSAPAGATAFELRTFRLSVGPGGVEGNRLSSRPAIDDAGNRVAFASEASNLAPDPNGAVRDVFVRTLPTGAVQLVSEAPGGADGPSDAPAISGDGTTVVFTSRASNLVAGDTNGAPDVFARTGDGPIRLVSASGEGAPGAGPSMEPDVSSDGRLVVFTSGAPNLVPDDTNAHLDVFVKDLLTGAIRRLSGDNPQANGDSSAPAISGNGLWVSFQSRAGNLVSGDRNRIGDVFVAEVSTGDVQRVSVSSSGREQNRAVVAPFVQVSDLSANGRYIAFDSDASNLVPRDRNRDTDVFVHDRVAEQTRRVSVNLFYEEGDNDSFAPAISTDGRYVAFESFAQNLAPRDRSREDVFVHDRVLRATSIVSVTARSRTRGDESVRQHLQRPAVAAGARVVAFTSTATNLVTNDGNRAEDVFVRLMHPPEASFAVRPPSRVRDGRTRYRMRADDRAVSYYLCEFDRIRTLCPPSSPLTRLEPGRHVLRLRAGGPGMLFSSPWRVARFRVP